MIDLKVRPEPLKGSERPRLAPPLPARSDVQAFAQTARDVGIDLYPWQRTAGRYLTAKGQGDRWLYRHVAIVVARQSGKTTLLVPLIITRLLAGHRIMHTAQDRNLPREIHDQVAQIMLATFPDKLARRGKKIILPRYSSGQEEIRMANGGVYSIVAPTRAGARGPARDLVIIDELREMDTTDFIAAAGPTMQASKHPQMVYLSNAGDETSLVLNSLRDSADLDPSLAYLEWSAAPDRAIDDRQGWAESNPSIGHDETKLDNLAADLATYQARGTLAIFETENLCRWVKTVRERLVDDGAWQACAGPLGDPVRPALGVSVDPDGRRASIALAWRRTDGRIALRLEANVEGDPVDLDVLGETLKLLQRKYGAQVGHEQADAQLVKYVRKERAAAVSGQRFKAASAEFARLVSSTDLVFASADAVTDDLTWTARRQDHDGSYEAVRAKDDHPIPAALAAIRAVWLASVPASSGRLKVQ